MKPPTPEQERKALKVLFTVIGLAVFGGAAAVIIVAVALRAIADWVFG